MALGLNTGCAGLGSFMEINKPLKHTNIRIDHMNKIPDRLDPRLKLFFYKRESKAGFSSTNPTQ